MDSGWENLGFLGEKAGGSTGGEPVELQLILIPE